ncbi:hypothetical protein H5410_030431 [Solanum commersonii]|uniref:Uncharacterized protein n=1 Tax=Solanum commersonii TaxID=4109 RepID=A0A9J5YG56_SOLCO|nr:hypothetical protein H5410_030431 [Solanum commersonii]
MTGTLYQVSHKSGSRACHARNMGLEKDESKPRLVETNHRLLAKRYSERLGVDKSVRLTPEPMVP